MEHKTIVDNPRESIDVIVSSDQLFPEPVMFKIIQETKGQFPDWPARNVITMGHAAAQQLASFIQNYILEL